MTTNTTPSPASQAPAVSIGTPEFQEKIAAAAWNLIEEGGSVETTFKEVFALIDAKLAQARQEVRNEMQERLDTVYAQSVAYVKATEAQLEAIRLGVEGLRWCYKSGGPRGEREAVWCDEVLALFTTPPKADESGLPG